MYKTHKINGLITIKTRFNEEKEVWIAQLYIANKLVYLHGEGASPREAITNLNHYIDCVHHDIQEHLDASKKTICTIL